jgi:hypothetical protein
MLLLACLYFTMFVLQHNNSQLLQFLHLHHCLQRVKSQVLARKIIWTQPDARDKQTEKMIYDKSIMFDRLWACELWWAEDDNHMYLCRKSNKFLQKLYCSLTWKSYLTFIIDMYNFIFFRVWVCPQTIKHSHSCTQHHTQNVSVFATLASFTNLYMITTCISEERATSSYKSCLTWKSLLTFIVDMYNFIFLGMSIDNQAFPFLHTTPYTQCEWVSFATAASFTNLSWGSWVWTRIDNNLIIVGMRYVS